jgi:hypothetical protein
MSAFKWLDQILCGLRGHDEVKHFEHGRVMMRCISCGHDSPGWRQGSGVSFSQKTA